MNDKVYVVTATVDPDGVVLAEAFDDADKANKFSVNGVKPQLREEYGNKMADNKTLQVGYHIREIK